MQVAIVDDYAVIGDIQLADGKHAAFDCQGGQLHRSG